MEQMHKKLNMIFGALIFSITFFTYLVIVAPTVSFWDCGEYAASCHTLEVPHPPGNPLFIMIGRVVSMSLFFIQEIGFRLNLLTVLTDGLVALLIYLIIVRIFIGFMGIPDTTWKRIIVYLSGFVGAIFAAFASTVAFCSVEAEVNQPLLVPIVLSTWLAIVWAQSKDPKRDRLLILITYVSFLGIGIHLYSMAGMLPIAIFVALVDKEKAKDWRLWTICILCGLALADVVLFFYTGTIAFILSLLGLLLDARNKKSWRFAFAISAFALLGFSCHLYLPVRSSLNPMIDENHPVTWEAFRDYLGRKQYGSENMVERMFWRRGTFAHQFGIEGNMGYGGFHITQFFHFSPLDTQNDRDGKPFIFTRKGPATGMLYLLIYLLPTLFMFYGFYFLYKKYRNVAIFLIFFEFCLTIGLVCFNNFSDGTRAEKRDYMAWERSGKQGPMPTVHREVRVRDYFFIIGFLYFGMWIGIAAGGTMYVLYTNKRKFLRTTLAPVCTVLFAVSPALPMSQNIPAQSRRGNYVPFDYAYNLLMTCEKDGVLITNGDNDTFPLWALQEAYGIRRDVRIVNLSLLNTNWYGKQMKNLEPKVPISFSDAQIDGLTHELNPFTEPTQYTMRGAGISVVIPGRKSQEALRVQDNLVLNIIDSNKWKKPIYFAVTVSDDNFMGLDPYLQMQGLAYRILPQPVPQDKRVDIEKTQYFLDKVYRFRGLGDGSANLEETTQKLLSNYAACYIQIGLGYRQPLMALKDELAKMRSEIAADTGKVVKPGTIPKAERVALLQSKEAEYAKKVDRAVTTMDQCVSIMPTDWRPRMLRQEFLMNHDRLEEAEKRAREAIKVDPDNTEYMKMLTQTLEMKGKHAEANGILKKLVSKDPDPLYAYSALAKNYEANKQYDSAIAIIQEFQQMHPGDRRSAEMINRYQALKAQMAQAAALPAPAPVTAVPEKKKTAPEKPVKAK
jgi:tetratricopeptide (TPR) repeat protein